MTSEQKRNRLIESSSSSAKYVSIISKVIRKFFVLSYGVALKSRTIHSLGSLLYTRHTPGEWEADVLSHHSCCLHTSFYCNSLEMRRTNQQFQFIRSTTATTTTAVPKTSEWISIKWTRNEKKNALANTIEWNECAWIYTHKYIEKSVKCVFFSAASAFFLHIKLWI